MRFGQGGAVRKDHGGAQCPRGGQLGLRACAAGVLGDEVGDVMRLQQRSVARHVEGATGQRDGVVRQWNWSCGRINETQKVVVLGLGGEEVKLLFADGEEDVCGGLRQRCGEVFHPRDGLPFVADLRAPRRAFKADQRDAQRLAGGMGVAAHLCGKRVRGIDDVGGFGVTQIGTQTVNAAEATDAQGQGLIHGRSGAASVGERCVQTRICETSGHLAGFSCAAQQEDMCHV